MEACTLLDTSVKIPESSMGVWISTLLFSFSIYIVSLVVCCTFLVWLCVVPCISFLRMELETIYRNRVLGCLIIQPQPSYSSRSLQLVSEPLGSFFGPLASPSLSRCRLENEGWIPLGFRTFTALISPTILLELLATAKR